MKMIDYTSCLEDPDLWIRKAVNNNRWEYYEYMLLYVENFLCVSRRPRESLEKVNKYFPMKASSIVPPKIYLGSKVGKVQLPNGVEAYDISMSWYVQESVKNVERYLNERRLALLKKASTPLLTNYIPEVGGILELDEREADFYQLFIRIL